MFKKLKDKLAEEVKSSPQRIQQFAQAAQAAVTSATSASSSISDITNSDLFTIGDNDTPQNPSRIQPSPSKQQNMFQDVNKQSTSDPFDYTQELDPQRQRRLSNSSFASDVSFRLPSYETPSSMYHLQSDMEVSASEADERGFSGGPTTLDRVTKEQLYSAYKRTQERYTKYRTQYGDLARHYKLLERENAKARSVLVETQDKALRRISELKEQCSLEQSAKAHLEKALRIEIDEKNIKIETLNTKIQLLHNNVQINESETANENPKTQNKDNETLLINLSNDNASLTPNDNASQAPNDESIVSETINFNNKIEKMEQLLNKYKESLKTSKDKNSQLTIELQKMSNDIDNKNKQIQELMNLNDQLDTAKKQIQELNNQNEDLQNQINSFDFNKTKETSTLEMDLQKANEEIDKLRKKNEVFNKREEEYAISIAENKLSIHKELESKEAEIKSLKDSLSASQKEIKSLKIVITDYKNNTSVLEEEKLKLSAESSELASIKTKYNEMETQLRELHKKVTNLEQLKTKADEEYKCLQLQLKQETAEKMAMIDRNDYLENRNTQLSEENAKKSLKVSSLEGELKKLHNNKQNENAVGLENVQLRQDLETWKEKCTNLESEIQEERIELVKLQAEIEKLLANHELLQTQNVEFRSTIANLTTENSKLEQQYQTLKPALKKIESQFKEVRTHLTAFIHDIPVSLEKSKCDISSLTKEINDKLIQSMTFLEKNVVSTTADYKKMSENYENLQAELATSNNKYLELIRDLDKLRDENNNLKENLNVYESENKSLNKRLNETVGLYEAGINDTELLKQENDQLNKQLKELKEISLNKETDLEDEKKRNHSVLEQISFMEENKQQSEFIIKELKHNISKLNEEVLRSSETLRDYTDKINDLSNNNEQLRLNISELQTSLPDQSDVEHTKSRYLDALEQIKLINAEKQKLNDQVNDMEVQNKLLTDKMEDLNKEREVAENKIDEINAVLLNKSNELEKMQKIQASLELEVAEHLIRNEELVKIENDKTDLVHKIKEFEDTNNLLNKHIEEIMNNQKSDKGFINVLTNEINGKSNEIDALLARIKELDDSIRILSEEKLLLKGESIDFVSNIKKLETEIEDIKKSHSEMEIEKDHLNAIIENLEKKESSKTSDSKDTQTEEHVENNATVHEPSALLENKWLLQNKHSMMSHTASLNLTSNEQQDLSEEYGRLKLNYETIKDENRRLQSDIEGLQSYLTKISKENSVLNDKLREVIATSEQSVDDQLSSDVKELHNNLQSNKEKINDLLRENSLLIEENLELKDQLQSQNYPTIKETIVPETTGSVSNEKEVKNVKEKLENSLQKNLDLEKRNVSLEQINKSVNGNVMQLQEKNERLKLSNEKLERRLDEALVSLRHLHSLQENTELEYLRNILYEYLTGSGTHSVTLAKVLSAIVKFDDSQTQQVMQKEKERQGLLRQLGLL